MIHSHNDNQLHLQFTGTLTQPMQSEMHRLENILQEISLSDDAAQLTQSSTSSQTTSLAAKAYKFIHFWPKTRYPHMFIWKANLEPKVKLFCWRLLRNKLPTLDNYIARGWSSPNFCIMCLTAAEDCYHLFTDCPFFLQTCSHIKNCSISINLQLHEFIGLPQFTSQRLQNGNRISSAQLVLAAYTFFHIWKTRCKRIFSDSKIKPRELASFILEDLKVWNLSCSIRKGGN